MSKRVLVQLKEYSRKINIPTKDDTNLEFLKRMVREEFKQFIRSNDKIMFQLKDDDFGGVFVDYFENEIPDKSVFKVVIESSESDVSESSSFANTIPEESISLNSKTTCTPTSGKPRQLTFDTSGSGVCLIDEDSHDNQSSDVYASMVAEQAIFYKKDNIKEFEKKVNEAAIELALKDRSLLKNRGELLARSRQKVAKDGYMFKKKESCLKVYGKKTTPKRPRYDKSMRDERLNTIDDELKDISKMMSFKEKRLSQAEGSKNYKLCEQVTEEIMTLKGKRRELETEKRLFEIKEKRAKSRKRSDTTSTSEYDSTGVDELPSTPSTEQSQLGSLSPGCSGSRINPIPCDSSPSIISHDSSPSIPSDSPLN